MLRLALICTTIYFSGVVIYSALFVFSSNEDPLFLVAKVFIAAAHSLFLIIPVALAQSRHIALKTIGFVAVIVYFVYAIFLVGFFPYFGFVPELYSFDFATARDLRDVTDHYFQQVFGWREFALIALLLLLFWQIVRYAIPPSGLAVIAVPVALVAASLYAFGSPVDSKKFGNALVLRRFGPVIFTYASLSELRSLSGAYLAENSDFPGKVAQLVSTKSSPRKALVPTVPKVSRVIVVQIESFDYAAIDARLSDLPVMPFVSGLRSNCLNYKNFFTMKGAGGSSDAEFSIATGLVPSRRVPALKNFDFSQAETLYNMLDDEGIASIFSHNNESGFYGRHRAYAQIEALETFFINPSEPVAEAEFATEVLSNTLRSSQKSLHFFFNFQSHGPYQGYSDKTEEKFAIRRSESLINDYLATMSEVDKMIKDMFELQQSGFADGEHLFMLLADHPSYLHESTDVLDRHRVPAMICHRDFDGNEVPNVFGSIDLFPTILEAFGLLPDNPIIGQSMFWDAGNAVLLPTGVYIYRDPNGAIELSPCDSACKPYFSYTEQHIRL